jgi:hypothetical protein
MDTCLVLSTRGHLPSAENVTDHFHPNLITKRLRLGSTPAKLIR